MPDHDAVTRVTIRRATSADYAGLNAVRQSFVRQIHLERPAEFRPAMLGTTEALFQSWLNRDGHFLVVAEQDDTGSIAGYASAWLLLGAFDSDFLFQCQRMYVAELAVTEASRKTGVGRALLDAVEVEARQQGVEAIELKVNTANTNARAFYDRLGFKADSEDRRKVLRHVVRIENP
jgi:ribosomal protein S18 acetylase RimI-like enzyme